MPFEKTGEVQESLGKLFRDHRQQQAKSLEEVVAETRISEKILQAIEEDDFPNLPADAFARGQYALYAKFLGLDEQLILERYSTEREMASGEKKRIAQPPIAASHKFSTLAEPPSIAPQIGIALGLFILLIGGALICWYLAWNPVRYLSDTLRNSQSTPTPHPSTQPLTAPQTANEKEPASQPHKAEPPIVLPETAPPLPLPEPAKQATPAPPPPVPQEHTQPAAPTAPPPTPAPAPAATSTPVPQQELAHPARTASAAPAGGREKEAHYKLQARFQNPTTLSIKIDKQGNREQHFKAGDTFEWQAKETIQVNMPSDAGVELLLNGIPIPIQKSSKGSVTVSLPEDLLN